MITILNYGLGNLGSIKNAFSRIGEDVLITSNPFDIQSAEKIILPGVGSFDRGMTRIGESGLITSLTAAAFKKNTPILGICLGMHLLTQSSEEGRMKGLGWTNGRTIRFNPYEMEKQVRVPHIGWNTLEIQHGENELLKGITKNDRFYFAHSYHLSGFCDEVIASTWYGYSFPSVIQKGVLYGIQCHPERSHQAGFRIFKNFARI